MYIFRAFNNSLFFDTHAVIKRGSLTPYKDYLISGRAEAIHIIEITAL
jgi:hypothetical protein